LGTVLISLKNTLHNCKFCPRRGWITSLCKTRNSPFGGYNDSKHCPS